MSKTPSNLLQSSELPPAQPDYVLRGHTAQIHCVCFLRQNLRLLTGDADGWVILWDLAIKRPTAVWKAHGGSVLGLGSWGLEEENIITHGRDNKLLVWQLRESDEADFSKILPIEDTTSERKQPWLLHSLDVNALNFCSFAMCQMPTAPSAESFSSPSPQPPSGPSILIAVPGVQDGLINITALPSATRFATIPPPKDTSTGMLMAVSLLHKSSTTNPSPLVAAGYESGHVALWHRKHDDSTPKDDKWTLLYLQKPHSQPVLSLDMAPSLGCFFSSSADAIVAKHPLDGLSETKHLQTKHAGQQSLVVRPDGKIFATAGWDGRVRVYAAKGMRELAVLKWHKEGCYAAAFADILDDGTADADGLGESAGAVAGRGQALTVSQRRLAKSKATHWLAAGSKDGRVSLWDIY